MKKCFETSQNTSPYTWPSSFPLLLTNTTLMSPAFFRSPLLSSALPSFLLFPLTHPSFPTHPPLIPPSLIPFPPSFTPPTYLSSLPHLPLTVPLPYTSLSASHTHSLSTPGLVTPLIFSSLIPPLQQLTSHHTYPLLFHCLTSPFAAACMFPQPPSTFSTHPSSSWPTHI
ncbi:unnamed protein product [Closterium sp. Naga37s-1]|nr:unnamed protein product [Closterium sp. Naga37s-1]